MEIRGRMSTVIKKDGNRSSRRRWDPIRQGEGVECSFFGHGAISFLAAQVLDVTTSRNLIWTMMTCS